MEDSEFDRIKRNLNKDVFARAFCKRPNTCVVAWVVHKKKVYHGIGFSKAVYPDNWDSTFGEELAKDRALTDIAVQILLERNGMEAANDE